MTGIDCARRAASDGAQVVRMRSGPRPYNVSGPEYDCKPYFSGNKRGWVALDSFSASAIVAVWDALSEANRAKFGQLRIDKMAKVAFKFVKVGGGDA